jgi:arginine-tRNA-protein transferase
MVDLFERHKQRFKFGVPIRFYDFLSEDPDDVPCAGVRGRHVSNGRTSHRRELFRSRRRIVSAIYAMFDPELPKRSLGILTMLKEIEHARECGKEFYYQGYAYDGRIVLRLQEAFPRDRVFRLEGKLETTRCAEKGNRR